MNTATRRKRASFNTNMPNLEPVTTRSYKQISSAERTLDPKLDPNPKTGRLAKFPKPANLQGFSNRGDRI